MAIQGWAKALRHQIKSGQADLAPHTSRGGRATARQAQAQLSRRRSGRQQGRAEEREEGAHIEPAADRGEQRQLKRRQRNVASDLSAAHPSPHTVSSGRWAAAEATPPPVSAYLQVCSRTPVHKPQVEAALCEL